MKTKTILLLLIASLIFVSCNNTGSSKKEVTGTFEREAKEGEIVRYTIVEIDDNLYGLETSSKQTEGNEDFKRKFYMELEYRPKNRIFQGNTAFGAVSFQFSKNHDTIREIGSSNDKPLVRVK